jgi:hypothetical protein
MSFLMRLGSDQKCADRAIASPLPNMLWNASERLAAANGISELQVKRAKDLCRSVYRQISKKLTQ